jgi:hypothetical protein
MSNEAKFTPGPHVFRESRGTVHARIAAEGRLLAIFKNEPDPRNAELWAAAPDLYAALSDCLRFLENDAAHLPCGPEVEQDAMALAKARGEA